MLSVVALAISFAGTSPAMHSSCQFVRRAVTAPLPSEADRGLRSTELIKFSSISDDYKELVKTALERLDRNRVLQGKPKYETIEGMIDSYVEASADAGYNWTREEAESEVTRYMMCRRSLTKEASATMARATVRTMRPSHFLHCLSASSDTNWREALRRSSQKAQEPLFCELVC